jgi:hypothetical protein
VTDISDIIRAMATAPATWNRERGLRIAQAFSSQLNAPVAWDEGAGEDWAQIAVDTGVRVLVGIRWPVVVVLEPDLPRLRAQIPDDVACVVVSDMDEPELSASEESLFTTFGDRARSAALTSGGFSATDLWFATV